MKVVAKPIDVITSSRIDGAIIPLKIRITENDQVLVYKVERIISVATEGFKSNETLVFECESIMNDVLRRYILKFKKSDTTWILFKI